MDARSFCARVWGYWPRAARRASLSIKQGRKAENLQDYDAAYDFYQKALKHEPENAEYQIKFNQARFEAGAFHIKQGVKLREQGNLQAAMGEFQRAAAIDPSSPMADQEIRKTADLLAEQEHKAAAADAAAAAANAAEMPVLASVPPEIKPLSRAPISLHMVNDAKIVFDTIGKLAGLTVVYDPDFPARRIPVDLNGVTLQQALDIVSMESKAFVEAGHREHYFRDSGPAAEAARLRRADREDFLFVEYGAGAGLDGNRDRACGNCWI